MNAPLPTEPLPPVPSTTSDIVLTREATNRLVGGLRGWFQENWQNTVVDIRQLSPQLRYLTVFGYGAAVAYLLLVLFFEVAGDYLPVLSFTYAQNSNSNVAAVASPLVLLLYSLSRTIGWALILAGASDCRRRIFLPIVGIFSIEYLVTALTGEGNNILLVLLQTGIFFAIIVVVVVFAMAPRLAIFQKYPLLEFGMWLSLLLAHMVSGWMNAGEWQVIVDDIKNNLNVSILFAAPFWIWLGIDGAGLIKENCYYLNQQIQRRVSLAKLPWVTLGLALLPLPIYFLVPQSFGAQIAVLLDFLLLPLALIGIVIFCIRPRGHSVSRIFLWVLVTFLLYCLFAGLAYTGGNLTEIVVGATGFIPPTTLFALLFLYDIAGFGTNAASVEGKWFPRSARLLIYLGAIIIASGFTLLIFNIQDPVTRAPVPETITVINGFIFLSLFFFAPLDLLRTLWRERKGIMADPFAAATEETTIQVEEG